MPRIKAPEASANPDFVLTTRLLHEFRNLWVHEFRESGIDAVKFTRLSVVALTQLSAILAVDVGMTVEQFKAVCGAQFDEAHKQAPKFG